MMNIDAHILNNCSFWTRDAVCCHLTLEKQCKKKAWCHMYFSKKKKKVILIEGHVTKSSSRKA